MNVQDVVSLIVNNGVAVGLLAYFVYRDNKFMNTLSSSLESLQMSVESVKKMLERKDKKDDEDRD